jgi:polyisoprenyl-teichoic acid--peptidoglycan teichoic acid transferase
MNSTIQIENEDQKPLVNAPVKVKKRSAKFLWLILLALIIFVFFTPFRVTTLVLGIDRPPEGTWIGRSDSMMLTTLPAFSPQISVLSIPRDLWVTVLENQENRINTAHYFAELNEAGTGMKAAKEVVERSFGVKVNYVVRIDFDGFINVVDAMGGVTVNLPVDMSGMVAGEHHLDGTQALRFVRDRKGSDDFFRQSRQQLFITSAIKQLLSPSNWSKIPAVFTALTGSIDSTLPVWLWPRVGAGVIFSAIKGFDTHTLDRDMATGWTTDLGAQVLLPNWELINPLVDKLFK